MNNNQPNTLSTNLPFDEGFFSQFTDIMDDMMTQNGLDKLQNPLADSPYVIGMMSGTSLDALDAVLCQFYDIDEDNDEPVEILATVSEPFPDDLRAVLLALTQPNGVEELINNNNLAFESELDVFGWASVFYAEFASHLVKRLLEQTQTMPDEVMAIGCHGQTVRHRPQWNFSLQLLDPNVLAERTGIAVVSDFRRRDMAVGGQGAPLVPAFHQAVFSINTDTPRAVLNLGGIANITLLNNNANSEKDVIGFDTGVANLLIDGWCQRHTGQAFDKNGDWAKSGQVIEPLLNLLLEHPFFAQSFPKSTGREAFNLNWLDSVIETLGQQFPNLAYSPADVQATLTELTAVSVAQAIESVSQEQGELFVCGGGALNKFLMSRLQTHLPNWSVQTTDDIGLSPLWVEAVAFAWLAQQTILNMPSNLPSVTGASKKVVLGQVCF